METLQDVFQGAASVDVNQVEYSVYLPSKQDPNAMMEFVQETLAMIRSIVQPFTDKYLWQKDQFHLALVQENDPSYPFLHGTTRFGDCIQDEWFIVFLLRHITLHIEGAVATVYDNDGDVLLIEAAMALPTWLDPSNSEHRVGLYQGKAHIIPLPRTPAELMQIPAKLTVERAIDIIRQPVISTVAEEGVQQAIEDRLIDKPELHRARCTLPSRAAYVLLRHPQLLPLAVEAFYLRDPAGLKACAAMSTFPPVSSTKVVLPFTRTTYAQTVSQKFYAPKAFRLPPVSQKKEYHAAELGMKVACGLEMLYHEHRGDDETSQQETTMTPERQSAFKQFLTRLTRLGYFRNERPGSRLHKQLTEQARQQFLQSVASKEDVEAGSYVFSNVRQTIDDTLENYSEQTLKEVLEAQKDEVEDDESWMNVDPKQLEELLMQRMGRMQEQMFNEEALDSENVDLDKMMGQFEQFFEGSKSGLEGVNFPGEDDESDQDDSDYDEEYEEDGDISFDAERFMSILKSALGEPMQGASSEEQQQSKQANEAPSIQPSDQPDEKERNLAEMMQEMDLEVGSHEKIGASFAKHDDEDENAPVDVSLNLVKNVLESYKSQQGLPGPAGNILGQFGIVLPADEDDQ